MLQVCTNKGKSAEHALELIAIPIDLISIDEATSDGAAAEDATPKTGLDARYDERFKQRMETLKRAVRISSCRRKQAPFR